MDYTKGFIQEIVKLRGDCDFTEWLVTQSLESLTYCLESYFKQTRFIPNQDRTDLILTKLDETVSEQRRHIINKLDETKDDKKQILDKINEMKDHIKFDEVLNNKQILSKIDMLGEEINESNKRMPFKMKEISEDCASEVRKISSKIDELETKKTAPVIPSVKGKIGEDNVKQILSVFDVKDVSKEGHQGDLIVTNDNRIVLVEVKNYDNPVPSSEVEKFYRDIEENNADAGLFISLKSDIRGHEGFELEVHKNIRSGKLIPAVFLGAPPNDKFIVQVVKILFALVRKESQLKIDKVKRVFESLQCVVINLWKAQSILDKSIKGLNEGNLAIQKQIILMETELLKLTDSTEIIDPVQQNLDVILGDVKRKTIKKPHLHAMVETLLVKLPSTTIYGVTGELIYVNQDSWLKVLLTKVYFCTKKKFKFEDYMEIKKGVMQLELTPDRIGSCLDIILL